MKLSPSVALFLALILSSLALPAATPIPPASWKNTPAMSKASAAKDNWWLVFGDAQLSQMIAEAHDSYPGLRAVLARVEQARAAVAIARSELLPRLDATGRGVRERFSENLAFAMPNGNTFTAGVELGYELDLWGRVRGGVRASRADEASANADSHALGLMLSSEVARLYFALRSIDDEKQVLTETLKLRQEALDMATARVEAGATNELDRVRAEAELAGTEAEIAALIGPRAELENTLAMALGRVASGYKVPVSKLPMALPTIPEVVPAELVQRRPDVASAMRKVEAAQARIGVAKAAYFPKVKLGARAGLAAADAGDYFDGDSNEWSFGLSFSVPLFVGGQRKATLDSAKAAMQELTGTYEEKVLTAFKEVESQMATLAAQRKQAEAQERLQTAADSASKLARQRYKEGVTTYLEVIEADRTALNARRSLVQLRGQRLLTTVQLIKALGGGWKSAQ